MADVRVEALDGVTLFQRARRAGNRARDDIGHSRR